MNNVELPPELKTSIEKERVQVPIDVIAERAYTSDQLDQLQAAGGIIIGRDRLQALHAIGVSAEQLGILRIHKGGIMVGMNALVLGIQRCEVVLKDEANEFSHKDKNEACRMAGYLAEKMSKVTSGAVKMDRDVAEVVMAADEKKRQSFQPGQRVTVNRDVTPNKA